MAKDSQGHVTPISGVSSLRQGWKYAPPQYPVCRHSIKDGSTHHPDIWCVVIPSRMRRPEGLYFAMQLASAERGEIQQCRCKRPNDTEGVSTPLDGGGTRHFKRRYVVIRTDGKAQRYRVSVCRLRHSSRAQAVWSWPTLSSMYSRVVRVPESRYSIG